MCFEFRRVVLQFMLLFVAVSSGHADTPPINLCATLPLTGKLAFSGTAVRGALELGVEDLNTRSALPRPVRLIVDDNGGEPQRAAVSVKKLIEIDGCEYVFSLMTHLTQAVRAEAARNDLFMLYWAGIDITDESPGFFKDWSDAAEDGREIVRRISRESYQRAALLHEQNDACIDVMKGFEEEAARTDSEIVSKNSFNPGETDFRTMLLRLKLKDPQVLVLCAWRDSGTIQRQLSESGLDALRVVHVIAPFLPANDTPELRTLYERNRALTSWFGLMPDEPTVEQESFVRRFTERFGFAPRMEAAFAFDGIQALGAAFIRCAGSLEKHCVRREFGSSSVSGVSGILRFDARRRSIRRSIFLQVKSGRWRRAD